MKRDSTTWSCDHDGCDESVTVEWNRQPSSGWFHGAARWVGLFEDAYVEAVLCPLHAPSMHGFRWKESP